MRFLILAFATFAGFVAAAPVAEPWGQCGGSDWNGPKACSAGFECVKTNDFFSQCMHVGLKAKRATTSSSSSKRSSSSSKSSSSSSKSSSSKKSSSSAKSTSTKGSSSTAIVTSTTVVIITQTTIIPITNTATITGTVTVLETSTATVSETTTATVLETSTATVLETSTATVLETSTATVLETSTTVVTSTTTRTETVSAPATSTASDTSATPESSSVPPTSVTSTTISSSSTSKTSTTKTKTSSVATAGVTGTSKYANEICTIGYCTLGSGTTGGSGGPVSVVNNLADLIIAVSSASSKVVIIDGTITGNEAVLIGANTTLLGRNASLIGVGLRVDKTSNNIIIRNIKISLTLAPIDAIGIRGPNAGKNIWVDHVELSTDMDHDKDYYDGLLDISHAADFITISNVYFHDHWKGSLIGHSENNAAEDTGFFHITYLNTYWKNVYSRTPSLRFGTVHVYNSFFDTMIGTSIDTRLDAQMLVEANVWVNTTICIEATDDSAYPGYAVAVNNDFGGGVNTAPLGNLTSVPYAYTAMEPADVPAYVMANTGAILDV